MSQVNWKTMKGPGDYDPPEHTGPSCIECGGDAELDERDDVIRCLEEECGHEEGHEDPRISAAEDAREEDCGDYDHY